MSNGCDDDFDYFDEHDRDRNMTPTTVQPTVAAEVDGDDGDDDDDGGNGELGFMEAQNARKQKANPWWCVLSSRVHSPHTPHVHLHGALSPRLGARSGSSAATSGRCGCMWRVVWLMIEPTGIVTCGVSCGVIGGCAGCSSRARVRLQAGGFVGSPGVLRLASI